MQDKINWCRINAPKSLQSLNDLELLRYMNNIYDSYHNNVKEAISNYSSIQELDKIFSHLVRVVGEVAFRHYDHKPDYLTAVIMKLTKVCNELVYNEVIKHFLVQRNAHTGVVNCSVTLPNGAVLSIELTVSEITQTLYVSDLQCSRNIDTVEEILAQRLVRLIESKSINISTALLEIFYIMRCFTFNELNLIEHIKNQYSKDIFNSICKLVDYDLFTWNTEYSNFEFDEYYNVKGITTPDFEVVIICLSDLLKHLSLNSNASQYYWNPELWQYISFKETSACY